MYVRPFRTNWMNLLRLLNNPLLRSPPPRGYDVSEPNYKLDKCNNVEKFQWLKFRLRTSALKWLKRLEYLEKFEDIIPAAKAEADQVRLTWHKEKDYLLIGMKYECNVEVDHLLTFYVPDDPIHLPGGPRIYRSPQLVIEGNDDFDQPEDPC
jgi:hypothetical protein